MHGLEWVFSAVLAAVFLITGVFRVFLYQKTRDLMPWVKDLPRTLTQIIGAVEILGALGLLLPVITGIYPWLTPAAAGGLALLMLFAAIFHLRRRETTEASLNVILLIFLIGIAYIRWPLMP